MKKLLLPILAIVLLTGCLATSTPVVTTGPNGQPVTNQVYSTSPWVNQVQGGVSAVAPLIPPPYGTLLTFAATLFGAAAAAYAAHKNKQANDATAVAESIIEGVESLGTAGKPAKEAIAATALANGNADKVDKAVQNTV